MVLNLNVDISKTGGEKQVIRFTIEGPKDSYVNKGKHMIQIIDLLKSLIHSPYLEEGTFSSEYLRQEKENLKRIIEARINDKRSYAIERCIEEMYKMKNLVYIL